MTVCMCSIMRGTEPDLGDLPKGLFVGYRLSEHSVSEEVVQFLITFSPALHLRGALRSKIYPMGRGRLKMDSFKI